MDCMDAKVKIKLQGQVSRVAEGQGCTVPSNPHRLHNSWHRLTQQPNPQAWGLSADRCLEPETPQWGLLNTVRHTSNNHMKSILSLRLAPYSMASWRGWTSLATGSGRTSLEAQYAECRAVAQPTGAEIAGTTATPHQRLALGFEDAFCASRYPQLTTDPTPGDPKTAHGASSWNFEAQHQRVHFSASRQLQSSCT